MALDLRTFALLRHIALRSGAVLLSGWLGFGVLSTFSQSFAILGEPENQSSPTGGTATFTVTATGSDLTYKWYKEGAGFLVGATKPTLTLTNVQKADEGYYTAVVHTTAGGGFSLNSKRVTLAVDRPGLPPTILFQPAAQTAYEGRDVLIGASVTGTTPLDFRWQKDGTNLAAPSSSSLWLTNLQKADAGIYALVITNIGGSVTSAPARLTITPAPILPSITLQPKSQTVQAPGQVTFTVEAAGTPPFSYQWFRDGVVFQGFTNNPLTLYFVTQAEAGRYSVSVANAAGSVMSEPAILTVLAPPNLPVITRQPQSQKLFVGQTLTLGIGLGTTGLSAYQWWKDGNKIPSATNSFVILKNVQESDSGNYFVILQDTGGSVTSAPAVITVTSVPFPPIIIAQPAGGTFGPGNSVIFTVQANGSPPLTYQWIKNGHPIQNEFGNRLILTNLQQTDIGTYRVAVSNPVGSVTSQPADLFVSTGTEPLSRLILRSLDTGNLYWLSFRSAPSQLQLQISDDLKIWQAVPGAFSTNGVLNFLDPARSDISRRFYRVVPSKWSR